MKITITGQTPSQKNSKQIVKNFRTGRMFLTSSNTVKDWQKDALRQLRSVSYKATGRIRVNYMFYVKNDVARDLDNMIASVNDILQVANASVVVKNKAINHDGIIIGDHWQVLEIGSAKAEIDRQNPRVEVTITELPNLHENVDIFKS